MSGGSSYRDWNRAQLSRAVREETVKGSAEFDAELSAYLNELLGVFNGRDVELVRERLDEAIAALKEDLESAIDELFGGSVAKHTYVDGLSDVDALIILKGPRFPEKSPAAILRQMASTLSTALGLSASVETGNMAITLTYPDGMKLQLLPALPTEAGLKVPSFSHNGWSEIDPNTFREALAKRNASCGGKLVPTIKLAKAIVSNFPEKYRLTGYHIESLAIAAFKAYAGICTPSQMLPHLFDRSKELVLSPIRDKTGQSVHVDEYLGGEGSSIRQEVGHVLGGIAKRMRSATAAHSAQRWSDLFESE